MFGYGMNEKRSNQAVYLFSSKNFSCFACRLLLAYLSPYMYLLNAVSTERLFTSGI